MHENQWTMVLQSPHTPILSNFHDIFVLLEQEGGNSEAEDCLHQ